MISPRKRSTPQTPHTPKSPRTPRVAQSSVTPQKTPERVGKPVYIYPPILAHKPPECREEGGVDYTEYSTAELRLFYADLVAQYNEDLSIYEQLEHHRQRLMKEIEDARLNSQAMDEEHNKISEQLNELRAQVKTLYEGTM